jgi:transcriptional regulator with XRE-family HTH domain
MTSEVMGRHPPGAYGCDVTARVVDRIAPAPSAPAGKPVGALLRTWRERRRLSQLDLALAANVSTRHLSYVENGRSRPTSAMILNLSDRLDVPLRERNALLLAGGYAPAFPEHELGSPPMSAVNAAINSVLEGHLPYPAVVVDRHWEMVAGNDAIDMLTAGIPAFLLEPPVNVLRLSLHPEGMAPNIINLDQWRGHILHRLDHQAVATGDPSLHDLYAELESYPGGRGGAALDSAGGIVVPLRYRTPLGDASFFSTTTVFGTPLDVTVAELAIEAFYPADAQTAGLLKRAAS